MKLSYIIPGAMFINLITGCTNAKSSWVTKCNDMKQIQKVTTNSIGMSNLPTVDKQMEGWTKIDCKSFVEANHSNCDKTASEVSSGMKSGTYDLCMQGALSQQASSNFMQSMGLPSQAELLEQWKKEDSKEVKEMVNENSNSQ